MSEPAPVKRRRDGAATREKIMTESLRLFAQKGFDATSVKDISNAVGVADAALYRHFPSKDDIAQEVFDRHYKSLANEILEIAKANDKIRPTINAMISMLCSLYDEHPDVFTFILINQHNHLRYVGFTENPVEEIANIMRAAIAGEEINISDPNLAAAIALGAAIQPAIFYIYDRLHGNLSDHKDEISASVCRALGVIEASGEA